MIRVNRDETTIDRHCALLDCWRRLSASAVLIETALIALANKRETLEERMIKNNLHQVLAALGESLQIFHTKAQDKSFDIDDHLRTDLSSLVSEIEHVFAEFNKMIDYDLNFLEQYYEHEFYARLANEHRFTERLKALTAAFENK